MRWESTALRLRVTYSGPLVLRAQAEVPSARRTDTPEYFRAIYINAVLIPKKVGRRIG